MGFSPWITNLPLGGICLLGGRDKALSKAFFVLFCFFSSPPLKAYVLLSGQSQGLFAHCFLFACPKTTNQLWQLPLEIIVIKNQGYPCVEQEASANKVEGIACCGLVSCDVTPTFAFKFFQKVVRRLILPLALSWAIKLALKASWGFPRWREILSGKEPT